MAQLPLGSETFLNSRPPLFQKGAESSKPLPKYVSEYFFLWLMQKYKVGIKSHFHRSIIYFCFVYYLSQEKTIRSWHSLQSYHNFVWMGGTNGVSFKRVFAKNETPFYRLTAKNKRFWSLLILLRSVVSIRRKLLKRHITKNAAYIQIQKVAISDSDRKYFFEAFVYSWYFIIFLIFHDLIVTFKNIYSCFEDFW